MPHNSPRSASRTAIGRLVRTFRRAAVESASGQFLRRQLWAWPVIAAVVLGGVGLWTNHSVESALRDRRAAELNTILAADVAALREWMKNQQTTAELLTETDGLLKATEELLTLGGTGGPDISKALLQAPTQVRFRDLLAARMTRFNYTGYILASPDGVVLAAETPDAIGKVLATGRKEFFKRVSDGAGTVSRPMKSLVLLLDKDGELRAGTPTMFAAAAVRDAAGKPVAALAFRIRPDDDFTRILRTARGGVTGDTYAFDRNGLLLSQSRFDADLKRYGLISREPWARSILSVELRDPGADLTAGERPRSDLDDMPFTVPVRNAPAGPGHDADGYRDYRGVMTLGAWTWLPEYDFGVVTEVSREEAYQPVYILRRAFAVLLVLLALAAVGIFVAMLVLARNKKQLLEAVLEAKQLGQYTLEEKLGTGGMGTVYKARHAMLRRPTAVKLLDIGRMSDTAVARFEREVQLTATLTHPNTVAIFDYGRTPEGVFYYAMEYLDGLNLDDLVARHGPLPEARVAHLLRQACGALAEAHHAGMVHRDVKPANVFLTARGGMRDFVKVLDFGLVKTADASEANLTSADAITGTPLYLSPEGITAPEDVDARADVYAVGAVAYYLLAGQPPFAGKTVTEILMKHVNATPESFAARGVTVGAAFEALVFRCLAKSPADRPRTAGVLLAELEACPVAGEWSTAAAAAWWVAPPGSPARTGTFAPTLASTPIVPATPSPLAEMTQVFAMPTD